MSIGTNIRRIKNAKKLSMDNVRELTGLSKSTISSLENDKSNPTSETLSKLAEALEVDVSEFYKPSINDTGSEKLDLLKFKIAKNLKRYRVIKGITQKQLANEINLRIGTNFKHNTISAWESGINSIDIGVLKIVCDILVIDISSVYELNDFNHNKKQDKIVTLYNGYPADILGTLYNLDERNYDIALNAINIRFGKVSLDI